MPWHVHISKQYAHVRGVYHPKPSSLESENMIVVGFLIAFLLIEMPSLGLSRNSIHIFKSSPIGCVVNLMPFLLILLAMVSKLVEVPCAWDDITDIIQSVDERRQLFHLFSFQCTAYLEVPR